MKARITYQEKIRRVWAEATGNPAEQLDSFDMSDIERFDNEYIANSSLSKLDKQIAKLIQRKQQLQNQ